MIVIMPFGYVASFAIINFIVNAFCYVHCH